MIAKMKLMSWESQRATKPVVAVLLVAITLLLAASATRARWRDTSLPAKQLVSATQPTPVPVANNEYVQRQRLRWDLQSQLKLLGDRLEKPGKERLVITGTVTRPNIKADKIPIRLIAELPDKIRLEELNGDKLGVAIFDGADLKSSRKLLDKSDENEIESLVFDAADHFFIGQMYGVATRFLGSHFRLDNGQSANYSGPFYDIFQIGETIALKKEAVRQQLKHYYFNSKTQFLDRIKYALQSPNNRPVQIEIQVGGWKQFEGQYVPTSLQRIEDGSLVFVLTIETVAISSKQADGIFTNF